MMDDVVEFILELLGELIDIDGLVGRWIIRRREQFGKWRARRQAQGKHRKE